MMMNVDGCESLANHRVDDYELPMLSYQTVLPDDFAEISRINQQEPYNWPEAQLYCIMNDVNISVVTAKIAEKVVGYIVYFVVLDEVRIINFVIDASVRGKKIGEGLLTDALRRIREADIRWVLLDVMASNVPAINLYDKLGFKFLCLRSRYYVEYNYEDAYFMQLEQ